MYGVPKDLDLTPFVGAELDQLAVCRYQIDFIFFPKCSVCCRGKWEAHGPAGELIDQSIEGGPSARSEYRVHKLLGKTVTRTQGDPPDSFSLFFEDGSILTVFDDSAQYESFEIEPGNIII